MEDFEFQPNQKDPSPQGYQNKRSKNFGTAAIVLGIIGIITLSPVCASLAIIFGLLSKGGELTTDTDGKIGIILGIIAMVLLSLIIIAGFVYLSSRFGGWENFLDYYSEPVDPFSSYPDTL